MSNVIQFLEALARRPRAPAPDAAAMPADLDPQARAALAAGDVGALQRLLGVPSVLACMVTAPDGEEPQRDDDRDDGDDAPAEPDARVA